jgi:hypothetical protein
MKRLLLAIVIVLAFTTPSIADRTLTAAENQTFMCGQLDTNADIFLGMPEFDPEMAAADRKEYVEDFNREMRTFAWQTRGPNGCHNTKLLNIAKAITLSERSYIQHFNGESVWESNLNQANQMLAQCTADFFGKPEGGSCQTLEEKNIAYKIKWKTAAAQ